MDVRQGRDGQERTRKNDRGPASAPAPDESCERRSQAASTGLGALTLHRLLGWGGLGGTSKKAPPEPVGCGGRHPTLTSLEWDREELQAPQAVLMSCEPPKKVRFDTKKLATRDGTRNRGDAVSDGRRRPHLPCAFLV